MKKTILHVPGTRPIGGIGSLLKSFDLNYDREKFNISYIYSITNDSLFFDEFVKKNNSRVYYLPKFCLRNLYLFFSEINTFYKNNAKNIDVLHVHCPYYGVFHIVFARLYGIKNTIIHSHNSKYSNSKLKSFRNRIIALSAKFFYKRRLACGYRAGNFLFGNRKYDVINNAIDTIKFTYSDKKNEEIRALYSIDKNEFVIGHVGSFVATKNHFFIISVFNLFSRMYPASKLILIGDGEQLENIKDFSRELGVFEKILFLHQIDNVFEVMSSFDCFILPSLFEGFPVSLVEAQSMGIPCVVSGNISRETKLTELVNFLPIYNESYNLWVDKLMDIKSTLKPENSRIKYSNILRNAGFDSYLETKKLENIYEEFWKEK